MEDLSPAEIRSLRGERTRAQFADLIGVTAHSIYRWELSEGSPHARRPRGQDLAKLKSLQKKLPDPAVTPVWAAIERALEGRAWRESENVLLRASGGAESRVWAATGLALLDLMFRADCRRALAALQPALAPDAPRLALIEATAAMIYSMPDGELFDVGLVNQHATRVDELVRPGDTGLAQSLSNMALATAALLVGDDDMMQRALGRLDAIASASLPAIPALFCDMLRSYGSALAGQTQVAMDRLDRILAHPLIDECANLKSRVLAAKAIRGLDQLGDPDVALGLARAAKQLAVDEKLATGVHTALALRAEAEALSRLGRLPELDVVLAESDRVLEDNGFPVTIVFPIQIRHLMMVRDVAGLEAMAAKLSAITLPSMRAPCAAYAAWFTATALFTRGEDSAAIIAAYEQAERLGLGWGVLRRDLLTAFASAAHIDGTRQEARAVLARAQKAVERRPSAWTTAHLNRAEATLLVGDGRIEEARTMMEAATATLVACGDRVSAALAHYGAAGMGLIIGAPDAVEKMAEADRELKMLGLQHPNWIDRGLARAAREEQARRASGVRVERVGAPVVLTPQLEQGLARIAVAGASFSMVMKELVSVVKQVTGAPAIIVDEDDNRLCEHAPPVDAPIVVWFDILGGPRRVRLGLTRVLDDESAAAMRVLLLVAGLAIQIVTLRGSERPSASPEVVVPDVPGLVVASTAMRRLLGDVTRLAGSRATITVTGESGAGKEVIARALHELSPRAAKPYVAFNCAAVPHDLFEGQLFGYRKGAFTGANSDHAGVIRSADGGTLFLDEIGELPLDIQPKLLRFLDAGEVFPLGAERPVTVDVRVIAATNRDLAAEVARGRFRQDLFYRLHVVPLVVPPLRDRRDDIVPLARHFVKLIAGDRPRLPTLAPDALAALRDYNWPGNVRELRNAVERALAYAQGDVITRAHLGL
ncbi:MAG: sigma 54-interacting transcriptional regulator [Kofleriaceae bacterium]